MIRFRDFRWRGTKTLTLIFEAKYYLVVPKIILMALYSIFLEIGNLLFPPLELSLHTSCAPGMVNNMNLIPTLASTGNCPQLHKPISVSLR